MILLLGGTSETAPLAAAFLSKGWRTLVSTATDLPLYLPGHPLMEIRSGRLDANKMSDLIAEKKISLVVDATHPFATEAHKTASQAAGVAGVPYLRWQRLRHNYEGNRILRADSHEEAARLAVSLAKPILLTTGSRNLIPYIKAATTAGVPLYARVLPHQESEEACKKAGLKDNCIIAARGPFSVDDTIKLIDRYKIGTLVTKESGAAGGLPEKLEAASRTGCAVVMINQPETYLEQGLFVTVDDIVTAIQAELQGS